MTVLTIPCIEICNNSAEYDLFLFTTRSVIFAAIADVFAQIFFECGCYSSIRTIQFALLQLIILSWTLLVFRRYIAELWGENLKCNVFHRIVAESLCYIPPIIAVYLMFVGFFGNCTMIGASGVVRNNIFHILKAYLKYFPTLQFAAYKGVTDCDVEYALGLINFVWMIYLSYLSFGGGVCSCGKCCDCG